MKLPPVIESRVKKINNMTEEEKKRFFSGMSEETLTRMASIHGHTSDKYKQYYDGKTV